MNLDTHSFVQIIKIDNTQINLFNTGCYKPVKEESIRENECRQYSNDSE